MFVREAVHNYYEAGYYKNAVRGVADYKRYQLPAETFPGVLVVRIVERRLYLTYKQKTVIKKSL